MISSIIIEALARRAKSVIDNHPSMERNVGPTVPEFHAAFVDELKRFENVELDNSATVPPKPARAKFDLSPQPSLGKGIGQITGGNAMSDGKEAIRLLRMITPCGIDTVTEVCGANAAKFVSEQTDRSNATVTHFSVTGKQLFWLREIKDKLIERGLI